MLDLPSDIPANVPLGVKIYKDQCIYNYDTPENNELGIDIDLKTYRAYSRNKDYNFTKQNYEQTGDYLYLNIRRTLKPQEEINKLLYDDNGEKSPKIQKLEIKNVKEEDYYITQLAIYDIRDERLYTQEEVTSKLWGVAEQILERNSLNKENEIKQWEQEIVPCPHSIDLQPNNERASELDSTTEPGKCHECELTENLWICLHCGQLGCGRQQYGSTLKGNGHALKHYEETPTHPVALKLGSLSNESESCDAYCYQCNDEVKVPDLAAKLKVFNIDLATAKKTEKSLVELNIDQNLNWDFRLEGANGEKLPAVYGKGLTGMQNLGNSCYLNSVLQALLDLDSYKQFILQLDFSSSKDPTEDIKAQLIKLYDGVWSGRYSIPGSLKGEDYQLGIKPSDFKTLIGKDHEEFKTQRQQDALEFLQYFFSKTDQMLGLKLNENFKFLFDTKIVCANCNHGSIKEELLDNISVPLPAEENKNSESTTIEKCLRSLVAKEAIADYQCDHCHHSPGMAYKSSGFSTYPKNLVIGVQRIKLKNWTPVKVEDPISLECELDLSTFEAPKFATGESENQLENREENTDASPSSSLKFVPNADALEMLLSMGFPEVRCINALHATGNSDTEMAMNWILANMDDPTIDVPLDENNKNSGNTGEIPTNVDVVGDGNGNGAENDASIGNLTEMGFSYQLSKKALHVSKGDLEAAVAWLFDNPDDDGIIVENDEPKVDVKKEERELIKTLQAQAHDSNNNLVNRKTRYNLKSVICHKGTSPHTGHYVVFIRKLIDGKWTWVLFNDEKVVVCDENNLAEIEKTGYIYIYEKAE